MLQGLKAQLTAASVRALSKASRAAGCADRHTALDAAAVTEASCGSHSHATFGDPIAKRASMDTPDSCLDMPMWKSSASRQKGNERVRTQCLDASTSCLDMPMWKSCG